MSEKDGGPAQSQMSEPVAWIEHHKGGNNLVWEQTRERCTPLYASSYAMGVADAARCRDAVEILPYDMPNEMWQRIRKDKEVAMEAFRIAVCQTLDEYEAAIRALSAPPSVTEEWVAERVITCKGTNIEAGVLATLAALGIEVTK